MFDPSDRSILFLHEKYFGGFHSWYCFVSLGLRHDALTTCSTKFSWPYLQVLLRPSYIPSLVRLAQVMSSCKAFFLLQNRHCCNRLPTNLETPTGISGNMPPPYPQLTHRWSAALYQWLSSPRISQISNERSWRWNKTY